MFYDTNIERSEWLKEGLDRDQLIMLDKILKIEKNMMETNGHRAQFCTIQIMILWFGMAINDGEEIKDYIVQ